MCRWCDRLTKFARIARLLWDPGLNQAKRGVFLHMVGYCGLQSPVFVAPERDWDHDYSSASVGTFLAMSDEELATVDPLGVNLTVAKGIPSLGDLDIAGYQRIVNEWTRDFAERCLPRWEPFYHESPQDFANDIRFFRLGMLCQYLDLEVGIQYNLEQREVDRIHYTNPSDLFLNGVIDTREGTCGNMAALHRAMGWRLGWPVALACVGSHFVLRFDDGDTIYNIEATQAGYGGFKSDPDDYLIEQRKIPAIAVQCGSDLRALRPREELGVFVGLRARHVRDVGLAEGSESTILASESDWLLARQLFPANRVLYRHQMLVTSMFGSQLFESHEAGHPNTYAGCLSEIAEFRGRTGAAGSQRAREVSPFAADELFFRMESNP